jgi:hypothetical protein
MYPLALLKEPFMQQLRFHLVAREAMLCFVIIVSAAFPVRAADPSDVFYGPGAGANTTSGVNDSAFGSGALYTNTSGSFNTAIGAATLFFNTSGHDNTASQRLLRAQQQYYRLLQYS